MSKIKRNGDDKMIYLIIASVVTVIIAFILNLYDKADDEIEQIERGEDV